MHCWEAAKRSQAAITELLLFRKSTGVILRDALPALQNLCANGPFEDCQVRMFVKQGALHKCECLRSRAYCQVRMFVKQPNRRLQQFLAVENKTILQQLKPSTLYVMFQVTLIFYPHHTGMRSEMLCSVKQWFLTCGEFPTGGEWRSLPKFTTSHPNVDLLYKSQPFTDCFNNKNNQYMRYCKSFTY